MSRITGSYVAQVEIEFDFEREPGMRPICEISNDFCEEKFTNELRQMIEDEIGLGKVSLTQMYAEVHEEED